VLNQSGPVDWLAQTVPTSVSSGLVWLRNPPPMAVGF